jgi:hypothetical protein
LVDIVVNNPTDRLHRATPPFLIRSIITKGIADIKINDPFPDAIPTQFPSALILTDRFIQKRCE